jgi:hypothetical protein
MDRIVTVICYIPFFFSFQGECECHHIAYASCSSPKRNLFRSKLLV